MTNRRIVGPIAAAVIVQSAGNLGLHAVLGRLLDPGEYGALGAVLAAMVMLGVPLGALQTACSALIVQHGLGSATARRTLGRVAVWSLPAAVAVLLLAPWLRDFFHLDGWGEAASLAPYLMVSAVLAAGRGLLLGARRAGAVAATYLVGTAARLGTGLALAVPLGVMGALFGTVTGEVAALAVAAGLLRRADRGAGRGRLRLGAVGRAGTAVTGLFLLSTVDLFLARHYLRGTPSGTYVAAATIAKTLLAVPAGIVSAVFPKLVAAWPDRNRGRALLTSAFAVTGSAVIGAAVVATVPSLVLGLLYGGAYAGAAGLVRTLAVVAALTSGVTLLTNAALARRSRTGALPWAGAVLEAVLVLRWHGSAGQVAACSAAAVLPTLLAAAVLEGRAWLRPTPQPGRGAADVPATEEASAR